jgi:site-specific recombinase XerD
MLPYQQQIHSILESYLYREGASYKTIKNYRSDIDDFLNWFFTTTATTGFHPTSVSDLSKRITPQALSSYRLHLEKELKTESTITRRYSSIRALIRACEDAGIIARGQLVAPTVTTNTPVALQPAQTPKTKIITQTVHQALPLQSKSHHKELQTFSKALQQQGIPQDAVTKKTTHIADFLSWFTTRHNH